MGKRIFICAGHGGSAPGNVHFGRKEKDDTLDMSRRITHYLNLLSRGADGMSCVNVLNARAGDFDLSINARVRRALEYKSDVALFFHTNGSANILASGAQAYISAVGGFKAQSGRLGGMILERLHDHVGLKNGGVKDDTHTYLWQTKRAGLGVLRGTCWKFPAVLVEGWYGSSAKDHDLMQDPRNREQAAIEIAAAVLEFVGIKPNMSLDHKAAA